MKNRKMIILGIIIIFVLGGVGLYIYGKVKEVKQQNEIVEYIPQEELTEEQMRQTIVSLYFNNKDTNNLIPEARSIDVKSLTKEPYITLINLLLEGPKKSNLEKTIPEGTKINKIVRKGAMIELDLSKEFIENHKGGVEQESKTIYSIVNTLTQLNEIESVKILVDGKDDSGFKDNALKFKNAFVRQE